MKEYVEIRGSWSDEENGWLSDTLELDGDCWVEITLPEKGRVVVKKSESREGPWPKALITHWDGPDFRLRLIHGHAKTMPLGTPCSEDRNAHNRFVKIITTSTPDRITLTMI